MMEQQRNPGDADCVLDKEENLLITEAERRVEAIKRIGIAALGRSQLLRHLKGKKLTLRQAQKAKCYECTGYYADGKGVCVSPDCPLYPFMPYRESSNTASTALAHPKNGGSGKRATKTGGQIGGKTDRVLEGAKKGVSGGKAKDLVGATS